jgi:hypothetical protein
MTIFIDLTHWRRRRRSLNHETWAPLHAQSKSRCGITMMKREETEKSRCSVTRRAQWIKQGWGVVERKSAVGKWRRLALIRSRHVLHTLPRLMQWPYLGAQTLLRKNRKMASWLAPAIRKTLACGWLRQNALTCASFT